MLLGLLQGQEKVERAAVSRGSKLFVKRIEKKAGLAYI